MANTIVRLPAIGTDTRIHSHIARGTQFVAGYMNLSGGSTYAAGGVTVTVPIKNLGFLGFENLWGLTGSTTATFLQFFYDRTNTKLQIFQTAGNSVTSSFVLQSELASDSTITALNRIYFFAIGAD